MPIRFLPGAACLVVAFAASPLTARAQQNTPLAFSSDNATVVTTAAPRALFPLGEVAAAKSSGSSGGNSGNGAAKFASGTGNLIYLAAGTLLPLIEDGKDGKEHALRTADSLLTSTLITEALKHVVRSPRPDNPKELTSFPSGHATAAFAVATMQAHYHPSQALLWYGGAALISYSRVKLNRHRYRDIAAGAAVGFLTSKLELSRPRGLILAPFIRSRSDGGGGGMAFNASF